MKNTITILLLLTGVFLNAQESYMSLSFGIGNPFGDYSGNTDLTTDGFASRGFVAEYSGAYYTIDYLGIGGAIKFNQNVVDQDAVKTELLKLLPEAPEAIERFDIGFWSIVSLGVGPQLTIPAGKINFDVYAFPGLYIVTPPKMELTAIVDNEPHLFRVSAQNIRFGFESGAAIRINLNSNTGLRLFASYLQTSSKGEILQEIEGGTGNSSDTDFSKTLQVVNTGIGLVINL